MMTGYRTRMASLGVAALLAASAMLGTIQPPAASAEDNQVFFRSGLAVLSSDRAGELFTDGHNATGRGTNDGVTGWYLGAGLDQGMHKNFLGIKGMSLVGELGIEFKRFNSKSVANSDTPTVTGVSNGAATNKVQITMLTVDVAPKLKFREGEKLRPWIIPVGLDFHVISPPSNQTNYLDIGTQHGVGIEYNFWGPLNVGLDGRYHFAANMTNTVNSYGTVGAYVGILY